MNQGQPPSPHRHAIAPLIVFPLLGPVAVAFTVSGPLALTGLFTLGPGALLYYLVLAAWWLPGLYGLLAPPFLLAGTLVTLAERTLGRRSLLAALVATEFAFCAYFAVWYLVPGGIETIAPDYMNLWSGFSRTSWSVPVVLVAAAGCWFVTRALARRASRPALAPGSTARPPKCEAPVLASALALGAAGLAAVLAASTKLPATAWKDCVEGGYEDRIRGCSVIVERVAEEPVDRRATAHLRRGLADEELKRDLARAIEDYSAAIRLEPRLVEAYSSRGLAYARQGEDERALADLDTALRLGGDALKPNLHRVFRTRGLLHLRRREFDLAIADHTEEIRLAPAYSDGYLHRGAAHLAKGDVDSALADFSEAIRIEPWQPRGYVARGSVHLTRGDSDRALADFDEAIRRLPNNRLTAPAYRKRAEALERKGDLAAALAAFETAVSLDPSDKDALAGRDRTRAALSR